MREREKRIERARERVRKSERARESERVSERERRRDKKIRERGATFVACPKTPNALIITQSFL